ncbi:potassium transporter Kef [Thermococcus thermotolerans]|uniref:potassium transporter Kef n=1 Tax=Thermococcus thermotolerans TaxID=2969672 RepID=UPI0021586133|nr:potassium transporter Kef [Thermococcus thermotolerans]
MKGRKNFLLLNFFIGTVFLAVLFYYALSLSWAESLLFAVVLSILYTSVHIFWERLDKHWRDYHFLGSSGIWLILFFLILFGFGVLLFGLIYLMSAKQDGSFVFLIKGLTILFIIGAFALFIVTLHGRDKETPEKVVYSWRNFINELSAFLLVFIIAYFSGVSLEKSVSMALYVSVIAGWYYSMMAHKYVISDRILKIRAVVDFVAITLGLYLFVIDNLAISGLIGALFAVASEKDYKITRKLVETGLLEKKYAEGGAWRLFYGIFYGFGAMMALMAVTGNYSVLFIRESLLTVFRLLYLFTAVFLPFGTLIGWLRVKAHGIKLDD